MKKVTILTPTRSDPENLTTSVGGNLAQSMHSTLRNWQPKLLSVKSLIYAFKQLNKAKHSPHCKKMLGELALEKGYQSGAEGGVAAEGRGCKRVWLYRGMVATGYGAWLSPWPPACAPHRRPCDRQPPRSPHRWWRIPSAHATTSGFRSPGHPPGHGHEYTDTHIQSPNNRGNHSITGILHMRGHTHMFIH